MTKNTVIVCSEEILGGTPVFKGTRVPVKTLIEYLKGGDSLGDFLEDFPTVSKGQALQVLDLAKDALLSDSDETPA
ncbi:MAG: DUF433 domain-containing protein [Chloroflexi bacterium]|nr:DUF433 domain-containing protein [Chloroflexota bacterium]